MNVNMEKKHEQAIGLLNTRMAEEIYDKLCRENGTRTADDLKWRLCETIHTISLAIYDSEIANLHFASDVNKMRHQLWHDHHSKNE